MDTFFCFFPNLSQERHLNVKSPRKIPMLAIFLKNNHFNILLLQGNILN